MNIDPAKLIAGYLAAPRWVVAIHIASFALLAIASLISPVFGILISLTMLAVRKDWR